MSRSMGSSSGATATGPGSLRTERSVNMTEVHHHAQAAQEVEAGEAAAPRRPHGSTMQQVAMLDGPSATAASARPPRAVGSGEQQEPSVPLERLMKGKGAVDKFTSAPSKLAHNPDFTASDGCVLCSSALGCHDLTSAFVVLCI